MRLTTLLCLLIISMALLSYSYAAPTHSSSPSKSSSSSSPSHRRSANSIRGRPVSTQTKPDDSDSTPAPEPEAEPPVVELQPAEEDDLGPEDPEDLGAATSTAPTSKPVSAKPSVTDAATSNAGAVDAPSVASSDAAPAAVQPSGPRASDAAVAPAASTSQSKPTKKDDATPPPSKTNSEAKAASDVKSVATPSTSSSPSTPSAAAAAPGDVDPSGSNDEAKMSATESTATKEADDTSLPTDGAPFAVAPSLDAPPVVPSGAEEDLNAIEDDDSLDPTPATPHSTASPAATSTQQADSSVANTAAATSTSADVSRSDAAAPSSVAPSSNPYSELEKSSEGVNSSQSSLGKPITPTDAAPSGHESSSLGEQTEAMAPEPRKRPGTPKPNQRAKPTKGKTGDSAKQTNDDTSVAQTAAPVNDKKKKTPQATAGAEVDSELGPAASRPLPSVSGPEPAAAAEPAGASASPDNAASAPAEPVPEAEPVPVSAPATAKAPIDPESPLSDSVADPSETPVEAPKSKPKTKPKLNPSGSKPKPPSGPKRASGAKPASSKGTSTKKNPPPEPEVAPTSETSIEIPPTEGSTPTSAPAKGDETAETPVSPSTDTIAPIPSGSSSTDSSSVPDLVDSTPTAVGDKTSESNLDDLPPAPVAPTPPSSKNKPKNKPKPSGPKQQPKLEAEPSTSLGSEGLSDSLDDQEIGDGGFSSTKPSSSAKPEKQKSKPTPPAEKPLPLCEVYSASTSFGPSGELSVSYSIDTEHECAKPKAMKLSLFALGVRVACNYTELITEEQLASADFVHHITLQGVGLTLVPGLEYHAHLDACKDAKHMSAEGDCVRVPGNTAPITRPVSSASSAHTADRTAIRMSIPSKISDYTRFDDRLVQIRFASREELLDAIIGDLANLIVDSDKESRMSPASLKSLKARFSAQFTDAYEADHMLKLSVMPASGTASGISSLDASLIAEHIRCIFTSPSMLSSSSALSLFLKPARVEAFDPCETLLGRDLPACTKKSNDDYPASEYRSSESNPYSSAAPTTRYDIDDAAPTKPSSSKSKPSGPSHESTPSYESTPSTSTYPKTTVSDDYPPPSSSSETDSSSSKSTSESPSTSQTDSTEIVDDISTPDPAPTHIVKESQWYDAFMLNPMYLMVFVGAILAVTFWALCMRTSSRAVTTESAADGDEAEQDLELGGVEMQKTAGSSTNGAFSAINTMDDDATSNNSAAPLSSPGGAAGNTGFTNEREDGSASRFLISVLIGIGIPSFGTSKYTSILKDNYLSTIEQLKQLDNSDWKRLGLPLVIEEALRKQLQEHTEKSGRFASGAASATSTRAKGLDLKSAAKTVNKSTEKKKSSILAAKPAEDSDPYEEVEANAEDGEKSEDKSGGSSSSKKKKEKKGKTSLLLAPPSNDSASTGVSALPTDDDDDDDFLKF